MSAGSPRFLRRIVRLVRSAVASGRIAAGDTAAPDRLGRLARAWGALLLSLSAFVVVLLYSVHSL